ncbi:hypothetical protein COT47_01555, partial [Candidatus Woesearchaeota archaeon CG08_land_8_20_14_0_20_43_7]
EAGSRFIRTFLGKSIDPESIIPTVGAMHGCFVSIGLIASLYQGRDKIMTLDPGFAVNKLQAKIQRVGVECVDTYEKSGDALVEEIDRRLSEDTSIAALLWSSPCNPSWEVRSESELEKLAKVLERHNVTAIEDNAYFGFDSRRPGFLDPDDPDLAPSIMKYTDNYIALFSASKIFSYAGERVGFTAIGDALKDHRSQSLRKMFNQERFLDAFIQGGLYSIVASAPRSAQMAFASLLDFSSSGTFSIGDHLRPYSESAREMKRIFRKHGFDILYKEDSYGPVGDGFYFTVNHSGYSDGSLLLADMFRCGLTAVPLGIFGGGHPDGLRICTSLVPMHLMDEFDKRLSAFDALQ